MLQNLKETQVKNEKLFPKTNVLRTWRMVSSFSACFSGKAKKFAATLGNFWPKSLNPLSYLTAERCD